VKQKLPVAYCSLRACTKRQSFYVHGKRKNVAVWKEGGDQSVSFITAIFVAYTPHSSPQTYDPVERW
jgi:hypothetical protein